MFLNKHITWNREDDPRLANLGIELEPNDGVGHGVHARDMKKYQSEFQRCPCNTCPKAKGCVIECDLFVEYLREVD